MSTGEDEPSRRYVAFPWDRVPVEHAPTPLPVTRLLGHTDDGLAVALTRVLVYPDGVAFRLRATLHPDATSELDGLYAAMAGYGDVPWPERLQIHVDLGAGQTATNEEIHAPHDDPTRPDASLVIVDGQGNGGTYAESEHWAWPLPHMNNVVIAIAWPHRGLEAVQVHLENSALRRAAAASTPIWPGALLPPPTTFSDL